MKTQTESSFNLRNRPIVEAACGLLRAEHPMTLRQLYYRVISAGILPNTKPAYARLGRIATRLRVTGTVPMNWIVDNVRSTLKPSSWSGLGDFGDTVRRAYRLDFWARLPVCVEILCEKDSVAAAIQAVTEKLDVALRPCRGFSSLSFCGAIADEWRRIEKPIFAYYIGDHDPSGYGIERDIRDKLERYSDRGIMDPETFALLRDNVKADCICWQRLAVVDADFDAFNLIPLPAKTADTRYRTFVSEHGTRCAEVEGIPPSELRRRVEAAILSHVDADEWAKLQAVEAAERETMTAYLANWK